MLFRSLRDNTIEVNPGNIWDFNVTGTSVTLDLESGKRILDLEILNSKLIVKSLKVTFGGIAVDCSADDSITYWRINEAGRASGLLTRDNVSQIFGGEFAIFRSGGDFPMAMARLPDSGSIGQSDGYDLLFTKRSERLKAFDASNS